ncbi:DUF4255 domain-containing protein [Paenibacillus sp. y28]|uniref:DUF4255 domain-containing protein n=1 Tax=Paenibacillus sp. y28 TaxID=3129110 RepID=UPI003016F3BA
MADYTVIAEVGQTLVQLLRQEMTPEPIGQPEHIGLAPPADKGDLSLSLFLYTVRDNPEHRRTTMISKGSTQQYPPMAVNLHYLVTAHSASDIHSRSVDEHRMLGKVMQVFHDHAVLRGSQLIGSLAERNEELRITREELAMENAFGFFQEEPYKLSLSYMVGPVFIDSIRTKPVKRVLEAEFRLQEAEGAE